jgi:hypothetical protein
MIHFDPDACPSPPDRPLHSENPGQGHPEADDRTIIIPAPSFLSAFRASAVKTKTLGFGQNPTAAAQSLKWIILPLKR